MSLINNVSRFPTKAQNPKEALLMCGFGGAIWQTRRLIKVLNKAGYNVTAMDFPKTVLSSGDPNLLPQMVREVVEFVDAYAKKTKSEILLVGISLGSLLSLNIFRRSQYFKKAIMITGGNIVNAAQKIFGAKVWPQSHESLSEQWHNENIFTEPTILQGKSAVFVLPVRDRLIDTSEVMAEIEIQNEAGNKIMLIKRKPFGHIGTIIEETIIFPHRILNYIEML